MGGVISDIRYAVRQLRQAPAFAIAVTLTLILAIGANTAIFSVVRAVLLQPLPYPDAGRLLALGHGQGSPWYSFSYPSFQFLRERLAPVADLAAYDDESISFTDRSEPVRLEGGRVSANFFDVLGVHPALGRGFQGEEDRHGATPVAVLSNRFWRQRYDSDPNILGHTVTVDGQAFTVVGVLPHEFEFLAQPVDVWRSRIVDTRTYAPASVQLGAVYLTVIARLHPGATLAQFRAMLSAAGLQYRAANPGNRDAGAPGSPNLDSADPLQQKVFANVHATLILLWGAVACLLAIACANVTNLVLARATARQRDINVRFALGASRWRIARQLIIENILLAALSAVLSLPASAWAMHSVVAAFQRISASVPPARMDAGLMFFAFAIATGMGVLFGLAPLGVLGGANSQLAVRGASSSRLSSRLRGGIVVAQMAICLVLLVGAGLLLGSFARMVGMRSGLRSDHVTMFPLDLMPDRYQNTSQSVSFFDEVIRRVGTIPGVRAAAITSRVNFIQSGLGYRIGIEGSQHDLAGARAFGRSVSADYFRVVGIPLVRGRVFTEHDTANSARVVIANDAFVRRFFPGADPIGRHIVYSGEDIVCEVVGIVGDVRAGFDSPAPDEEIYVPLAQRPWLAARLVVRTDGIETIAASIRERIRSVDPEQAVADATPIDEIIAHRLGRPRSTMLIVTLFATASLILAAVGIYGVIAYSVAQRRKEIGIRMALGADSGRIRALVFRHTARLVAVGLAIGLPISLVAGRYYASLLFDVQPGDPKIIGAAAAILIGVALAATHMPSARAANVDPLVVLRSE